MSFQIETSVLNDNITARKEEVFFYQFNIDNFTAIIAKLPEDWTEEALLAKTKLKEERTETEALLVAENEYREELKQLIIDNKVQQMRSQKVLDVLSERLERLNASLC